MTIESDNELVQSVNQAGELIQFIQDCCGRTARDEAKVRFPRGLIGTAGSYRQQLPSYLEAERMSNCAYAFMFLDVLWWLVARTDIASVARQMILRSAIVTLGTILEACLYVPGLRKSRALSNQSAAGVKVRVEHVMGRGWISQEELRRP